MQAYFQSIEVVHQKDAATYQSILKRYQVHPSQFLMVGNSLRSDILPVLEITGYAVYIPFHLTWAHESQVDYPSASPCFYEMESISSLPELVRSLDLRDLSF